MDAKELAEKFTAKVAAAVTERDKQTTAAELHKTKRTDDADHCKRALTENVIPFLKELQSHLPKDQFTLDSQIDQDRKTVGVSFRIGDGPVTSIFTALGNVIVTRGGASGSSKGTAMVYDPASEPHISNSGDLTRDKIAKLVEMTIDNV